MKDYTINFYDLDLLYNNEKREKRLLHVFVHLSFAGIKDEERNICVTLDMNKAGFIYDLEDKLAEKYNVKEKHFMYNIMMIAGKWGVTLEVTYDNNDRKLKKVGML